MHDQKVMVTGKSPNKMTFTDMGQVAHGHFGALRGLFCSNPDLTSLSFCSSPGLRVKARNLSRWAYEFAHFFPNRQRSDGFGCSNGPELDVTPPQEREDTTPGDAEGGRGGGGAGLCWFVGSRVLVGFKGKPKRTTASLGDPTQK